MKNSNFLNYLSFTFIFLSLLSIVNLTIKTYKIIILAQAVNFDNRIIIGNSTNQFLPSYIKFIQPYIIPHNLILILFFIFTLLSSILLLKRKKIAKHLFLIVIPVTGIIYFNLILMHLETLLSRNNFSLYYKISLVIPPFLILLIVSISILRKLFSNSELT